MAKQKMSYAEKLRQTLKEKAEKALASGGANELEFAPDFGTYKIRILPPVDPNDLFYHTHSYHWIPEDIEDKDNRNGRYLWTKKSYDVDGSKKRDPIDEAVQQFYSVGRKEDDEDLLKIGGILKRKRNFFCNIILYTDKDGEPLKDGPEFKVLVDKTNEGKLMRLICAKMGIPFWRDVEDNWVDKDSTKIDPEKDYYDLIDVDSGRDFKIVKKSTGKHAWDISYEDSFVMNRARKLNDTDKELMEERVDLKTWIAYEDDYDVVKETLEGVIGNSEESEEAEDITEETEEIKEDVKEESKKKSNSKKTTKKKAKKVKNEEVDDEDIEDLLDELD